MLGAGLLQRHGDAGRADHPDAGEILGGDRHGDLICPRLAEIRQVALDGQILGGNSFNLVAGAADCDLQGRRDDGDIQTVWLVAYAEVFDLQRLGAQAV